MEIFRTPDSYYYAQMILDETGLSLGQWYCVPMLIAGVIIYIMAIKHKFKDGK
jgi:prolipoprotein diacylglyceryltransferase